MNVIGGDYLCYARVSFKMNYVTGDEDMIRRPENCLIKNDDGRCLDFDQRERKE